MIGFEYVHDNAGIIIGIAELNKTVSDFDEHLEFLNELHGDLERHHENNKLWVTRCSDDEIVMSFDEIEKELEIYFI